MGKRRHRKMQNPGRQSERVSTNRKIDWNLVWPLVGLIVTLLLFILVRDARAIFFASVLLFACLVWLGVHIAQVQLWNRPKLRTISTAIICVVALASSVGAAILGWPETELPSHRSLSSGQQMTLRNALAGYPSEVMIAVPMQDVEADEYAQQFLMVFLKANWRVPGNNTVSVWESRPTRGIRISYKQQAESSMRAVAESLKRVGLKSEQVLIPTDKFTANNADLELVIGKNPKAL